MPYQVLIDTNPAANGQKTGIGYYTEHLLQALSEHPGEFELHGYYFDPLGLKHRDAPHIKGMAFKKVVFPPAKLLSLTRRFGFQPPLELFTRQHADIVFFTNYVSLPLVRKTKVAIAVHDLGFLDHPEYIQDNNLRFLQKFCSESIVKADLIITISAFTKSRIRHHFPNLSADIIITPIPPAVPAATNPDSNIELQKLGLEHGSYILYVGTIEPRKNLATLIEGYVRLPKKLRNTYALVLAGGNGWKNETILETAEKYKAAGENIVLTGYVSEQARAALYEHARCFTLPSHYEGFGMPVFEAFQHKLPVAVSDIDVFREIAQNAAEYFDKDDPGAIAFALARVLEDEQLRMELVSRGGERLDAYSWANNAQAVQKAFLRTLGVPTGDAPE